MVMWDDDELASIPRRLAYTCSMKEERERWEMITLRYSPMCAGRSPKTTARHMCDNVFITGASSSSTTRRVLNEIYQDKSRKHVRHRRPGHASTYRPRLFFSFFFFLILFCFYRRKEETYNINEEEERETKQTAVVSQIIYLLSRTKREISNCWCGNINQKPA